MGPSKVKPDQSASTTEDAAAAEVPMTPEPAATPASDAPDTSPASDAPDTSPRVHPDLVSKGGKRWGAMRSHYQEAMSKEEELHEVAERKKDKHGLSAEDKALVQEILDDTVAYENDEEQKKLRWKAPLLVKALEARRKHIFREGKAVISQVNSEDLGQVRG